ncbi:MAG: heme-binding protein [Microbacteriaceae bacterium]|nr:heme-binding protein [Microbacteriaceae bacterium]
MPYGRLVLSADDVDQAVAAVIAAVERGRAFAIAVVDETGDLLAFRRSDRCAPHTAAIARAKAYTAARVRMDTGAFEEFLAERGKPATAFGDPGLVAIRGGVVLRDADGGLLGGIAVSGFAPAEDEELALLGRAAIRVTEIAAD